MNRPIKPTIVCVLVLLSLILSTVVSPRAVSASPLQQTGTDLSYKINLPVVNAGGTLILPQLLEPADGAQMNTLIPVFKWDMGTQAPGTRGCLAFGINPHPTSCQMKFDIGTTAKWQRVLWYNLEPSTVYYWRVGLVFNDDWVHPVFSDERVLTTGPAGGTLPAAPILVTPDDITTVTSLNLTLAWQPVPGTSGFCLSLRALDVGQTYGFNRTLPDSQFTIDNFDTYAKNNGLGIHFAWSVFVRNEYGWSTESAVRYFTYGGTPAIRQTPSAAPMGIEQLLDGGTLLVIQ